MPIPKILHFTWKSRDLPPAMAKLYARWQALHPDWDIRFYTDADIRAFMVENFPEHMALFDFYPRQIQRVDIFRYYALYKLGGIYSDIDVEPFRPLDEILPTCEAFVGVEPEAHSAHGPDGVPYQLCNALMGSSPGHPFWPHLFSVLERCKTYENMLSTGPRMLNGAGLTAPRPIRPAVLAADYWSPVDFYGRRRPASQGFTAALGEQFPVVGAGQEALTSHIWAATWMMNPLSQLLVNREKSPERQWYNVHNRIKWALRRRRYPEVATAADTFPRIEQSYGDQILRPLADEALPSLLVAVSGADAADPDAFAAALARLDYPPEKIRLAVAGPNAARIAASLGRLGGSVEVLPEEAGPAVLHNLLAERAGDAGACVFLDARVTDLPPDTVRRLLAARRPVVAANTGVDGLTYRYENRALFKRFYRQGGTEGVLGPQSGGDVFGLEQLRHLQIAPLDCVSGHVLLVDGAVLRAGVRFAETPYKLHDDARGFAVRAREAGFAVCGLPELRVGMHPSATLGG